MNEDDHESPIEGIVKEEYQRQKSLEAMYEKELKSFPKGSLTFQKRKGQIYAYLKYRDGKETINKYVGPEHSESVKEMEAIIVERRKTETLLKEVKKISNVWRKCFVRQTKQLFLEVMTVLSKHDVLEKVILIGSWCQLFYQIHFKEDTKIPAVRTLDLDFLIPNPPNIEKDINVSELLENMGFKLQIHAMSGVVKYDHPSLMVEFLIPELGRGKAKAYDIPKLHVKAVGLRYLNLLQAHVMEIEYESIKVKVPEPAAFALHKHIVSKRRLNLEKKQKDKQSAVEIGRYLLGIPEQREKLQSVFAGLPKKWQKTLLQILKEHHKEMYEFLWEIK